MIVISARNVQQVFPYALRLLKEHGVRRASRNGGVLQMPQPVSTVYQRPHERVMFWHERDANPFLHFYESLWMLAGRNDVAPLKLYTEQMGKYSDDQVTLHGAYGYRWRVGMPYQQSVNSYDPQDQLKLIGQRLAADRTDRRCVLQMWDSRSDLGRLGADVPCNDTATFQIDDNGALNMVVFCRSNDIIWGAYGANAVHFSFLHEYMASRCNARIGTYTQVSVNWHGYDTTFPKVADPILEAWSLCDEPYSNLWVEGMDPYQYDQTTPRPIADHHCNEHMDRWDQDLKRFMRATHTGQYPVDDQYTDTFFEEVALPIVRAHTRWRTQQGESRYTDALNELRACRAPDWAKACREWIGRRYLKWAHALDGAR